MAVTQPQGIGIGLRACHYDDFLAGAVPVPWVEVITENFLGPGRRARALLERVRRDRPTVFHGVGLDVGGAAPINLPYLRAVRALAHQLAAPYVSDHLSACTVDGAYVHDLLPVPCTEEMVGYVAARARVAQDALGLPLLLENPSTYVQFDGHGLTEWEFLAAVAEQADCRILLDVNNIYVSCHNHGWDPQAYLAGIPPARVGQMHLAGHTDMGDFLLDSHGAPVAEPVWALFATALAHVGPNVPTLIEWDEQIPPLPVLLAEAARARTAVAAATARAAKGPGRGLAAAAGATLPPALLAGVP